MPEEANGHESPSRLDRIERAVEALIGDHERLRASQKDLLRAQVIMVDTVTKLAEKVDDHEDRIQALVDGQLRLDEAMTESRRQFQDFVEWAKRVLDRPSPPA
jgi:hypothetical protein